MVTTTTGLATSFITFSRPGATGGGATVTDSDGKIKWAGHNLLTNSESFDASAWTKGASTVTANALAAPNSTTTADAMFETALTTEHTVQHNLTSFNGTNLYRAGAYIKANGRTKGFMRFYNTISPFDGINVDFDLTAVSQTGVAINGGSYSTSGIQDVGGGWYYVWGAGSGTSTSSTYAVQFGTRNDAGSTSYLGDITKGLYLWGAHLYRSDLGGMVLNPARGDAYYPTTPRSLVGFSEDFGNALWFKTGVSVTSDAAIAPNGLQTADKLVEDGSTGEHRLRQTVNTVGGTRYTLSFYAKAAERNWVALNVVYPAVADNITYFNLTGSGSIGTNDPDNTASITSVGDGWYRCSVTHTTQSAQTSVLFIIYSAIANNTLSHAGVSGSGLFIWGAQLSDSASLDAYSPVYGAAVTSAAYYAPRLDFDPVTLAARGLLVEEQRTNLLRHTNAFTTAPWQALDGATLAQDQVGPDGVANSAWTVTDSNASAGSSIFQPYSVANDSKLYVGSLFFKKTTAAASFPSLTVNILGGSQAVVSGFTINTNTGVATASTSNQGPTATCVVTDYGAYWRVEIRTANNSTGNVTLYFQCFAAVNTTGNGVFNNATTGSTVIYGAQLEEAASFATSYIPNGPATSGATRTSDVASVSTQAFPYSSTAGTYVANFRSIGVSTGVNPRIIGTDLGNDAAPIYTGTATGAGTWNGASPLSATGGSTISSAIKIAMAHDTTGRAFCYASGTVQSDANTMPTFNTMRIGVGQSSATTMSGWIRQITYIPRRLSNAELQARTL